MWGRMESETIAIGWRQRLVNDSALTETVRRKLIDAGMLHVLDVILYETDCLAKIDSSILGWLGKELGLGDKIEFELDYDPRRKK